MPNVVNKVPSYLAEATKKQKYVFFQTLVCLSEIDGQVDEAELDFIKEIAKNNELDDMQLLMDYANAQEVIDSVKMITDRHLAMELIYEMCKLAHVDNVLSDNEIVFIGKIGQAMGIEIEKIEQISNWIIDCMTLTENAKIIFEEEK